MRLPFFAGLLSLCTCGRLGYDSVGARPDGSSSPDAALTVDGTAGPAACPAGYVPVPPSPSLGVDAGFCVAKYEMQDGGGTPASIQGGTPWASRNQIDGREACGSLGESYGLIRNPEWMTVARDIETVADNWEAGSIGGQLSRGHSDNVPSTSLATSSDDDPCFATGETCSSTVWHLQRRTHQLSNGEVLWDFAGNLREYVDWNVRDDKAASQNDWIEINPAAATAAMPDLSFKSADLGLTQSNGIGAYYPGTEGSGGAASRGGFFRDGSLAGVFTLFLANSSTASGSGTGARCVFHPDG
jgi:hypothetical protein